jgi:FtsP/CotA-like multicopper oxidase with cupredoxin domain
MQAPHKTRRDFFSDLTAAAGMLLAGCNAGANPAKDFGGIGTGGPADVTLRIDQVRVDIAKDCTIHTVGYNGSVPGPLIRLREGVPVTIDIFNETDTLEFVHWHGQTIPAAVDGTEEERSLAVPARGHLRYEFTPQPSGSRFVHTHAMSMSNLNRSTFTGQYAFTYIEPRRNSGQYDQEVFLSTHEWEPYVNTMEEDEGDDEQHRIAGNKKEEKPHGLEVAYHRATINGRCLGYGEPIRVKAGQRVLFHLLNASATENIRLALPGHQFEIVALDGNPAPHPQLVDLLELGTAERIDAVVEMNHPGVWILGSPKEEDRKNGMGIVVEYANKGGAPRWIVQPRKAWDYTLFGENRQAPKPDEVIPLVFGMVNGGTGGFEEWTINGRKFNLKDQPRALTKGRRYRLIFDNQTEDAHPVHLHRNSFELTNVHGKATSGVIKDVVLVKAYKKIEVDVTPSMEGLTLFHCHQQMHMENGFELLFDVT